jgi:4-hydroxyphenylacetate 3-monooxygenase
VQITPLRPEDLEGARVVVAGYTGRDQAQVRAHIDELAEQGIAPPPSVPMFYPVPADLLTQEDEIDGGSATTSGEVEPVLVVQGEEVWLTIGSDHTDREIEKSSVADSKAACPKPVARTALRTTLDELGSAWDDIEVTCAVDGVEYQSGTLAALLPLPHTLELLRRDEELAAAESLVVLGGTLPLIGGQFVFGTRWEMTLHHDGDRIDLGYTVRTPVTTTTAAPTDHPTKESA